MTTAAPASATTAVVPSCDFDAVLATRDAEVRACEELDALLHRLPGGPSGIARVELRGARGHQVAWELELAKKNADRSAWQTLMLGSGLWTFLDHDAREQWRTHLDEHTFPPFTRENAEQTILDLHERRPAMVARGVLRVFERLRGHYRSNKPNAFGSRMIVTGVADVRPWRDAAKGTSGVWVSANHRTADDFDDLNRVLHLLRGLPEPDHRSGSYAHLGSELGSAKRGEPPWECEFPFFMVRVFLNGNGHVYFKHDTDVDQLNRVLAYAGRAGGAGAIADDKRPLWGRK